MFGDVCATCLTHSSSYQLDLGGFLDFQIYHMLGGKSTKMIEKNSKISFPNFLSTKVVGNHPGRFARDSWDFRFLMKKLSDFHSESATKKNIYIYIYIYISVRHDQKIWGD